MRRLEVTLRSVAEGLDLPASDRADIIEEIAADVDELRVALVRAGWPEEDAEHRAIEILGPLAGATEALSLVHEPRYRALERRLTPPVVRRVEAVSFIAITAATVTVATAGLVRQGLLRDPSPSLWLIFGLAGVVSLLAGRKAIQLFALGDHHPHRLWRGMNAILWTSALAVVAAFTGAVLDLAALSGRVEVAGASPPDLVLPWLLDTAVLAGAGLLTALFGGLCWFLLATKIGAVELAGARVARILEAP